jgi:serine O-acetyltransferase
MSPRVETISRPGRQSVWAALRAEAAGVAKSEPALAGLMAMAILNHDSLSQSLGYQLTSKLEDHNLPSLSLRAIIAKAYRSRPAIIESAENDLQAILECDPACTGFLMPFLFFKGFLALQTYRVAHWLHLAGRETFARHLQARCSDIFDVDIHPAAIIGSGVFIDHGTGIVIGETAVVGDDVSMLQGVTLGASALKAGKRHPTIGAGVLLSADSTVLGPITVGNYAKVAAGSVVLRDVPARCTAVGVPARLVNCPTCDEPGRSMDQGVPDFG